MALQLKRAKDGTAVLTVQYELDDDAVAELMGEDGSLSEWLSNYYDSYEVAFLDRPARGAVVVDMMVDAKPEVAGPAEWAFEPVGPAQAAPAGAGAGRDPRFDGGKWWESPANRDDRFAPVEVK